MASCLEYGPSRIELARRTRDGVPLTAEEARIYAAILAVAQRHGIRGTDSEIEKVLLARPDLQAEIRRTLQQHEDGWT